MDNSIIDSLTEKVRAFRAEPEVAITTALAVTAAGLAARQLIGVGWRVFHGERPPRDPARRDVDWPTALAWTTAVGFGVGVVRLVTRRAMSRR